MLCTCNTFYEVTLMEITIIKTMYVRHIVQFKFQPDVLCKPITFMSEDILPVSVFKAVKSSYNICRTHQMQNSF